MDDYPVKYPKEVIDQLLRTLQKKIHESAKNKLKSGGFNADMHGEIALAELLLTSALHDVVDTFAPPEGTFEADELRGLSYF